MRVIFDKKDRYLLWILFLILVVLLPNVYLLFAGSDLSGSIVKKLSYTMISLLLVFVPCLFLKLRTLFLLYGIFVVSAPIEIVHIYLNKMPVTTGFLMSILGTDMGEAMEVISALKFFFLLVLIVWTIYFVIVIKKVPNKYLIVKIKSRIALLFMVFGVLLTGFGYQYWLAKTLHSGSSQQEIVSLSIDNYFNKFSKIYPYSIAIRFAKVVQMNSDIRDSMQELSGFSFSAQKQQSIPEREIYIVVIGETARYSNFSVNGYNRPTSPLLEKQKNLVSFSNYYSQGNLTSLCLPLILTRATALNIDQAYSEKSFVEAFSEAGFKTYWIANQSAGNRFIRRISATCDGEYFMSIDFDAVENYDEKLWKFLDYVLQKEDEKVLIVLHTLGSHFRYNFRYPSSFEQFHPCLQGTFDYTMISPKNKELLVNTYDNSILYTDYFLYNTIQKIDSLQSVSFLMYFSDHGENLYDTPENIVLHAGLQTTHYDVHVPLFVWTSSSYNRVYSQKQEMLFTNKDKKISTPHLFYSVLDMADIDFPEQDSTLSIVRSSLEEDSVRYLLKADGSILLIEE